MKELVSVIIPILNPAINPTEERILHHTLETLSAYPLIFVTFEGADLSIIKEHNEHIDVIYFPVKYFESRKSLSQLYLLTDFYDQFNWSEFLLIHELNSWVIRDELYYWCKQGYDYLRAEPDFNNSTKNPGLIPRIRGLSQIQKAELGQSYRDNGLCLCRIERMTRTLKNKTREAYAYRHDEQLSNSDSVFWDAEANRLFPNLRKPTSVVQKHFAVSAPVQLDNTKLPFALTGITHDNIRRLPYFQSLQEEN